VFDKRTQDAVDAAIALHTMRNKDTPPDSVLVELLEMLVAHTAYLAEMGVVTKNLVRDVARTVNTMRNDPACLKQYTPQELDRQLLEGMYGDSVEKDAVLRRAAESEARLHPPPTKMQASPEATGVQYEDGEYGLYAGNAPRMPYIDTDSISATNYGLVRNATDQMYHYRRFVRNMFNFSSTTVAIPIAGTVIAALCGVTPSITFSVLAFFGIGHASRAIAALGLYPPLSLLADFVHARAFAIAHCKIENPTASDLFHYLMVYVPRQDELWAIYGHAQEEVQLARKVTNYRHKDIFNVFLNLAEAPSSVAVGLPTLAVGAAFVHMWVIESSTYSTHRLENYLSLNTEASARHWIDNLRTRIRRLLLKPYGAGNATRAALLLEDVNEMQPRIADAWDGAASVQQRARQISNFNVRMLEYERFYRMFAEDQEQAAGLVPPFGVGAPRYFVPMEWHGDVPPEARADPDWRFEWHPVYGADDNPLMYGPFIPGFPGPGAAPPAPPGGGGGGGGGRGGRGDGGGGGGGGGGVTIIYDNRDQRVQSDNRRVVHNIYDGGAAPAPSAQRARGRGGGRPDVSPARTLRGASAPVLPDDSDDASDDAGVDPDVDPAAGAVAMALNAPRAANPGPNAVAVLRPSPQQRAENDAVGNQRVLERGGARAERRVDNQRRGSPAAGGISMAQRSRRALEALRRGTSEGAPCPSANVSVVDRVFSRLGL